MITDILDYCEGLPSIRKLKHVTYPQKIISQVYNLHCFFVCFTVCHTSIKFLIAFSQRQNDICSMNVRSLISFDCKCQIICHLNSSADTRINENPKNSIQNITMLERFTCQQFKVLEGLFCDVTSCVVVLKYGIFQFCQNQKIFLETTSLEMADGS